MSPEIAAAVERMTVAERHDLISEIWDTFEDDDVALTPAQQEELDRRLDAIERGEMGFRDWEEIKAEWDAERKSCRAA